MVRKQLELPFGPLRNSALFSNHWLEHRLPLEPEWNELRDEARGVLDRLAELWSEQHDRVEHYGNEQGLEYAFIQPVSETPRRAASLYFLATAGEFEMSAFGGFDANSNLPRMLMGSPIGFVAGYETSMKRHLP
jgi:hypothetical protein